MKIGILTVYSFNYGSFFQATALYNELKRMGHEVEFINEKFKMFKWGNLFLLYSFDKFMPSFAKEIISNYLPQYRTFLQLRGDVSNYKESSDKSLQMSKLTKNYDLVILGADEMWSASDKSIRYTKEHFGYDISCPHISYATCGSLFDMKNSKLKKNAARGLKTFKDISVRDLYTSKVVEKLTGKKVEVVLDPTLLNPYFVHDYVKNDNDKYILLYGQHYDEYQKAYIIKTAKEMNCKIKSLGWPISFADEFLDPKTADEFQGCFAKAEYCFPSTFHGTIFSILNHRPFLSMVNSLRGKKIKMLLKDLNLDYRIFDKDKSEYTNINYDEVEKLLEEKREFSRNILLNSIKGIQNIDSYENAICGKDNCTSCGACINACRFNAIKFKSNEEGFYRPYIDTNKCVNCGICKRICPAKNAADFEDSNAQKIYAGYSINRKLRVSSSSGGAFMAIAQSFIKASGVVYGAVFDEDNNVKHIKVNNLEELNKFSGSKYVQSSCHNAIALACKDIKEGKNVLFSGTPCQIAAIKKLAANKDLLYTIDILCHGVPSPVIYRKYLDYMSRLYKSPIESVSFRDKTKGWKKQCIRIKFENGKEYINTTDKDPFYVMYFKHVIHSPACHSCKYTDYSRISDITLGDLWGVDKIGDKISDIDKGVSMIMTNTVKGNNLLLNAEGLELIEISKETAYQPILRSPSIVSKDRDVFWRDYKNQSFSYVLNKYGKLSFISWCIKKIFVPITKSLGIYDIVQKLYFGRNIQK